VGKILRVLILIVVLVGSIGLAQKQAAWAQPSAADDRSAGSGNGTFSFLGGDEEDKGGTVKPPPKKVKACKRGTFSVGGVSVLKVKRLADDYCVMGSLQKRHHVPGKIPPGAGTILADITLFQVLYRHHFVSILPDRAGHVELCYAIPPGVKAKLYYRDHLQWKRMDTNVRGKTACARVFAAGYYALIGK
jgi:hypothetical protein